MNSVESKLLIIIDKLKIFETKLIDIENKLSIIHPNQSINNDNVNNEIILFKPKLQIQQ
jgi:hypothetical protein